MKPKENETIDDISLLDSLLKGYFASVTFFNDVPSDWGVKIIEVACKFMDDDGNNDNKAYRTNLVGNGDSYTLVSTYEGCCRAYFGLVKVKDRGKVDTYPFSQTVEKEYCGGNLKWHLVPENKVARGGLSTRPLKLVLIE